MSRNSYFPAFAGAMLLAWLAWSFWDAYRPRPTVLQGQIEAQEYSISSKVPGRIDTVFVRRGDPVRAGQRIFRMDSPELQAKLAQAQGAAQAAGAIAREANAGARAQEIEAARDQWHTAKAAEDLARKTFERLDKLFNDGVVAEQRRDEVFAAYQAAQYTTQAAYQVYSLALEGARSETIEAAEGQQKAAAGLVAEVEAARADIEIRTPYHGEIANVFLHAGELAPTGFPVVTVVDMDDAWAVFQVREDLLHRVQKDTELTVRIPALGDVTHQLTVTHISVLGDFATWRATNATEGYDLRTFEVEARPRDPIDGLRAGMTVLLEL